MSSLQRPAPVIASRPSLRAGGLLGTLALAAILLAGCATDGLPSPPASTSASLSASPSTTTATPSLSPATTPATTAAPASDSAPQPTDPPGPPGASLSGRAANGAPGVHGRLTWAGMGSDSPWLVPPAARAVPGPGPFVVTFAPALPVEQWTARWAPVRDDLAGDPTGGGAHGTTGVVRPGLPAAPGTWSLQVSVRFAGGGSATWYWRVEAGL